MAMHKPGDLVWAKMKGFPHWPAMVLSPADVSSPIPNGRQPVLFYGTHETAFMKPIELYAYRHLRERYEVPRNLKGFNQAIREIRIEAGIENDDLDERFFESSTASHNAISHPSSSMDLIKQEKMDKNTSVEFVQFSISEDPVETTPNLTPLVINKASIPSIPMTTSSGRTRRPKPTFSPDDYESTYSKLKQSSSLTMGMQQEKEEGETKEKELKKETNRVKMEERVTKKAKIRAPSNKNSPMPTSKIKFRSMRKKEDKQSAGSESFESSGANNNKKGVFESLNSYENTSNRQKRMADRSSELKSTKRTSSAVNTDKSANPFESFDLLAVNQSDSPLVSPMFGSAAVPIADDKEDTVTTISSPGIAVESKTLRHSRRVPKPRIFDDFVLDSPGRSIAGRVRVGAEFDTSSPSSVLRNRDRFGSEVFEDIAMSIEPINDLVSNFSTSSHASPLQTEVRNSTGKSEKNPESVVKVIKRRMKTPKLKARKRAVEKKKLKLHQSGVDLSSLATPKVSSNGQRRCPICKAEVRPQMCGNTQFHRWRCVSKPCRKWYGWLRTNEEIPGNMGHYGRWRDTVLKLKRKNVDPLIESPLMLQASKQSPSPSSSPSPLSVSTPSPLLPPDSPVSSLYTVPLPLPVV